jgi:hypothetical protein
MWTQVVGKIRLKLAPPVNHWWHVTLYVTARGLTTSPIPVTARGLTTSPIPVTARGLIASPIPDDDRTFEITFDFIGHQLRLDVSNGDSRTFRLAPMTVEEFYRKVMQVLGELNIGTHIWPVPVEVEVASRVRFDQDRRHASYDAEWVLRWWDILRRVDEVLEQFRGRFIGKSSPVHFFWGGFDLAVTRFNGRRATDAPRRADPIQREGYSHEVISAGFWPGGGAVSDAAFYVYAAPEPAGFKTAPIRPAAASYDNGLGEFLLPYESMRTAPSPRETLLEFLQSTYEAAADLAKWDRAALERAR